MGKEKWKDTRGYEGLYKISDLGRIKSISDRDCILKPFVDSLGYMAINLKKDGKRKTERIHRLVAMSFIPNPKGKREVNHINGIKSDSRLKNLEWCTPGENRKHAYSIGLIKNGSKHHFSRLNENRIILIRKMASSGYSQKDLAIYFGVTQSNISHIVLRKTWAHVK